MTFHVLQSYLFRTHIPIDKDLLAGAKRLFLSGIGYWNSMGFLTTENTESTEGKTFAILCDSLRIRGSMILTTEDTESTEGKTFAILCGFAVQ